MSETPSAEHRRPVGIDDATVEAVGRLTEALETTERARGHLYTFHQLTGSADLAIGDAERSVREQLTDGRRHLHEAAMKERRRTRGHPDHTAR